MHLIKWGIDALGFGLVLVILRRVQGSLVLLCVGHFQKTDAISWLGMLIFFSLESTEI